MHGGASRFAELGRPGPTAGAPAEKVLHGHYALELQQALHQEVAPLGAHGGALHRLGVEHGVPGRAARRASAAAYDRRAP